MIVDGVREVIDHIRRLVGQVRRPGFSRSLLRRSRRRLTGASRLGLRVGRAVGFFPPARPAPPKLALPGVAPAPDLAAGKKRPNILDLVISYARALPGYAGLLMSFSAVINLLLLVAPLYMLQVYDRVLTSGSGDTLVWLTVIAVFLLAVYGAAEAGRRRVASLAVERLDARLTASIARRFAGATGSSAGLLHELSLAGRARALLQNQLIFPFFDLPFAPLFLAVLFFVHPVMGAVGVFGAVLIVAIAIVAETSTRHAGDGAAAAAAQAQDYIAGVARERSAMTAMGLATPALQRWRMLKDHAGELNIDSTKQDGVYSAAARAVRQILQILTLATGAALAITQQISPGAIVAGSIILARALGPIDQIVGSWRSLVQASIAWGEVRDAVEGAPPASQFTPLPAPNAHLALDRLSLSAPGSVAILVRPFSLELSGGASVALVGANGAGKSTVLQTLSGAWPAASGAVILGGRSVHAWPGEDRGRHVGYAPQASELLPATIGENIARLSPAGPEEIIAAAMEVGAHEAILALPRGYDTPLGPAGTKLSTGQRQQINLARAFFRNPTLLLLDEPTANLDRETSLNVIAALQRAAARGAIVIAATHDRILIGAMKTVLTIRGGAVLSADSANYLKATSAPLDRKLAVAPPAQISAADGGSR